MSSTEIILIICLIVSIINLITLLSVSNFLVRLASKMTDAQFNIESEDELSDDECAKRLYDGNCTYYTSKKTEEERSFETSGLKWKKRLRAQYSTGYKTT